MKPMWLFSISKFWFLFSTSEGSRQGNKPYIVDCERLQTVGASMGLAGPNDYVGFSRKRIKAVCS